MSLKYRDKIDAFMSKILAKDGKVIAEAKILTKLFANKKVQISISLFLNSSSKILAFFFPVRAKLCILGFEAEVSEVSDPEKNADNIISPKIDPIKICSGISIVYSKFFSRKLTNSFSLLSV